MTLSRILLVGLIASFALGCSTSRFRPAGNGNAERGREVTQNKEQPMSNRDPRIKKIRQWVSAWRWPVLVPAVTSHFGRRELEGHDERFHEGIDFKARPGTAILAAHSGQVLYAGDRISGYGNMVVVRSQTAQLSTVYAHASKILVKEGSYVKRGTRIALSGNTGRSTGPHVHFEVRLGSTPVDPLAIMPRAQASGRKIASVDNSLPKRKKSRFTSKEKRT